MTLGVAVLGAGRFGGRYLDVVKATRGAEMKVLAEPREEQVAPLEAAHPDVELVPDYRQALERDDVDVVVAALPHWLHRQAAIDAALAGKHILMEKPLAPTVAECDEMLAAAREHGVKLMTAHMQRFMPVVKRMKEIVDSRRLGDLVTVHDVWHKSYEPDRLPAWLLDRARGGGLDLLNGVHMIDRLLWLVGPDLETVSAQRGAFIRPELPCDDTIQCFLRWGSGRVATLSLIGWRTGLTAYGADCFFTRGQARLRIVYENVPGRETGVWIGRDEQWIREDIERRSELHDQFQAFVDALERGDGDTPVPQAHGRRVIEVLEALGRSAAAGREVRVG